MTAPLDEQAMRERHPKRVYDNRDWCDHCGDPWPCELVQALDALAEAETEREDARRGTRAAVEAHERDHSRVAALEADLQRAERVVEAARAVDNFGDLSDAAELASWEGLRASLAAHDAEVTP